MSLYTATLFFMPELVTGNVIAKIAKGAVIFLFAAGAGKMIALMRVRHLRKRIRAQLESIAAIGVERARLGPIASVNASNIRH